MELALRVAGHRRDLMGHHYAARAGAPAAPTAALPAPRPPPVFVLFATAREADEAAAAWGRAVGKRGVVAVAVAADDGRGYRGKVTRCQSIEG